MTQPVAEAAWRRSNLGHLLFVATGRCVAEVLRIVHAAGFSDVTEAQLGLFGNLDPGGTRLTVLAGRAGVAKQSVIEMVDRAAGAALVVRNPDPTDARAKIVSPTSDGERLMRAVRRGSAAATRLAVSALGASASDTLRRNLSLYAGRVATLDQLLGLAAGRFVGDVLAAVHRHGQVEVTEALLTVLRHLDLEGSRLTDLAVRARITKQSMRGLVARVEALGLVERQPDAADRRARTIRFTPAGHAMLGRFRVGVDAAEALFVDATGGDPTRIKLVLSELAGDDHAAARAASTAPEERWVASAANSPG